MKKMITRNYYQINGIRSDPKLSLQFTNQNYSKSTTCKYTLWCSHDGIT